MIVDADFWQSMEGSGFASCEIGNWMDGDADEYGIKALPPVR